MTERVLGPPKSRRRRTRLFVLSSIVGAALMVFFVVSAGAVLPGSPSVFESGNDPTLGVGNEVVDNLPVPPAAPHTDWISVTGGGDPYVHLTDAAASTSDDSFTPGQKQDTVCPTIEGHKNPPKDDFTDVASYVEKNATTGDTYLYGATIRYAPNGNASENIELKQGTSGDCAPGFLARTPGDKLIAIDYLGGGSAVQFHVLTWVASGPCNVANDPAPCWGANVQTLDPSVAEGGVSIVDFTAAQNPISGVAIKAGQFAEFGVNLTDSGIVGAGECAVFSQTIWESRSSGSSFVSSTKDITIEDKDIDTCAGLSVIKLGSDGGSQEGVVFTLYSGSDTTGTVVGTCTVDASGNCLPVFADLNAGTYTIDETGGLPPGYVKDPTLPFTFTLADNEDRVLTFTDVAQRGAIKVTKTSIKGNTLLAGATFSVTGPGGPYTLTTGADGTDCLDDLAFGDYVVTETAAPGGYAIDDATPHNVTIDTNAECPNASTGADLAFSDTPLTDITATANSQDDGPGGTLSDISCVDSNGGDVGNSPQGPAHDVAVAATGLHPGTYTCTIVIDP
jgi:Prealbumin-like fold domain